MIPLPSLLPCVALTLLLLGGCSDSDPLPEMPTRKSTAMLPAHAQHRLTTYADLPFHSGKIQASPEADKRLRAPAPDKTTVHPDDSSAGPSRSETGTSTADKPAVSDKLLSPANCALRYTEAKNTARAAATDPLLARQWHLNNSGAQTGAVQGEDLHMGDIWHTSGRGENIRVAVVDDALEVTHDDLRANIVPNASYNYGPNNRGNAYPLPCTASSPHGTQVAGVLAARDFNGIGGSGVAPHVRLVGYNALATGNTADVLDAQTRSLGINAIYNNSWGPTDWGHFTHADPSDDAWQSTIDRGLRNGRKGQGAIYLFAAGNGAQLGDYSGYDSTISALGTIAVCATNAAGQRAIYSEAGANLLVCAPSGDFPRNGQPALPTVTTTSLQNQYTEDFNGTSAATPMVSGVVALMLQANPALSWRDVQIILAHTARRVVPRSPGWRTYQGLAFHHEYGFGVVDAQTAVATARRWRSVGNSHQLRQCGPYRINVNKTIPKAAALAGPPDYNTPPQGGLSTSVSPTPSCNIQHIEHTRVKMSVLDATQDREASDPGGLQISLTAPTGHTATLALPHTCYGTSFESSRPQPVPCMGLVNQTFGLSRFMDQPATTPSDARWTLQLLDRHTDKAATRLQYWELTLYGR
ncbi:MAG: S8 family serine peptidase [Lautropia sp.]|nr:S8 family serine peptidase [Lautropia sp.]